MAVTANGEGKLRPTWLCLRDCFTYNRYHYKGRVYDLPDNGAISPKNFRLMEERAPEAPLVEPTTQPQQVVKEYKCPVCGKVVSTGLALAGHSRSHRKEVTHGSPDT